MRQVEVYRELAFKKSDLERTELQKEKTGVFTGCYAKNPANGQAVPIWVADYVLGRLSTFFYPLVLHPSSNICPMSLTALIFS